MHTESCYLLSGSWSIGFSQHLGELLFFVIKRIVHSHSLHEFLHVILQLSWEAGTATIPILQRKKLRHEEVK